MTEQAEPRRRASYLSVDQQFNLNHACRLLIAAFGHNTFQVGSSLTRADYRDVDLRCILDDDEFDAMFAGKHARLALMNVALSEYLDARTSLPIDFQFQRKTDANADHKGERNFMGTPLGEEI